MLTAYRKELWHLCTQQQPCNWSKRNCILKKVQLGCFDQVFEYGNILSPRLRVTELSFQQGTMQIGLDVFSKRNKREMLP